MSSSTRKLLRDRKKKAELKNMSSQLAKLALSELKLPRVTDSDEHAALKGAAMKQAGITPVIVAKTDGKGNIISVNAVAADTIKKVQRAELKEQILEVAKKSNVSPVMLQAALAEEHSWHAPPKKKGKTKPGEKRPVQLDLDKDAKTAIERVERQPVRPPPPMPVRKEPVQVTPPPPMVVKPAPPVLRLAPPPRPEDPSRTIRPQQGIQAPAEPPSRPRLVSTPQDRTRPLTQSLGDKLAKALAPAPYVAPTPRDGLGTCATCTEPATQPFGVRNYCGKCAPVAVVRRKKDDICVPATHMAKPPPTKNETVEECACDGDGCEKTEAVLKIVVNGDEWLTQPKGWYRLVLDGETLLACSEECATNLSEDE